MAVGRAFDSELFQNALMVDWPPAVLCLPLSPKYLLVATPGSMTQPLEIEGVNIAFAELSREFFVSNQNTATESRYFLDLGKRSALVPTSELHNWARESIG